MPVSRFRESTYVLAEGPPAWTWDAYRDYLSQAWPACLDGAEDEGTVQDFLERHPSLVPGGPGRNSETGHHGNFLPGVVTQPNLRGTFTRRPDFMWISGTSAAIIPVLIEIERPGKKWFKSKGVETAELTQARNQLREWKTWMGHAENQLLFRRQFGFDKDPHDRLVDPRYWLVYGRRSEVAGKQLANRGRLDAESRTTKAMTYDRLSPVEDLRNAMTLKQSAEKYTVVHIQPTLRLGPHLSHHLAVLDGLDAAIERNDLLDEGRKQFLIERLVYWNDWIAGGGKHEIVRAGDSE